MVTHSFSLEALASRVVLCGFEGPTVPDVLLNDAASGKLLGVVLFSRNVESATGVRQISDTLQQAAGEFGRVAVAVDQEGGRVIRLRSPLSVLPPAARFGEIDDPQITYHAGLLVGRELSAVGITLNFAPVLDVNTNPDSPIIGDRAFGATPHQVVRHGLPFARGLADGGVWPCAKHFPGHGDANVDSHLSLPQVTHDATRLHQIELEPFMAYARLGLGPVMSAHIVFDALDPDCPATLSRPILTGLLREKLRFGGAVLTDDLEMGAMDAFGGPPEVAVRAIKAGADGLLVCRRLDLREQVVARLQDEARRDGAFERKLQKAVARLTPLAYPVGPPVPLDFLESAAHRALSAKVVDRL